MLMPRVILATICLTVVSGALAAPALASASSICHGKRATIVGTPGDDRIVGTKRRDVIVARGGDDLISSGGGNDVVCAGAGRDRVDGTVAPTCSGVTQAPTS
jgi:hypothetical protein